MICVHRAQSKDIPDLSVLASRLFDLPAGTDTVSVLLALLKRYDWVEGNVRKMIASARERNPKIVFEEPLIYEDAGAVSQILADIAAMGLASPPAVNMEILRTVLGTAYVLCAGREDGPNFRDALHRAGFPDEAWEAFFVERAVKSGRNSNLTAMLTEEAKRCEHALYAWSGLRTLDAKQKKKFTGKCYEADTPAKVIEIFRRWIIGKYNEHKAAAGAEGGLDVSE